MQLFDERPPGLVRFARLVGDAETLQEADLPLPNLNALPAE
jgi:hypothetical protein